MPQYLKIAEKIYQNVKEKKGFTDDPMEDLNNLMIELRQEIKGTKLKLFSVHDKFHRTLILSGFCLLKIAKIS
ncbi:hypothetical protein ABTC89_12715, partial [Acinetobacter baumannii]|nr:hypothetical protein [Acinetobacter baumannii]